MLSQPGFNPTFMLTYCRDEKSEVDDRVKELQEEFEGLDEDLARVIAERDEAQEKLPEAEKESEAADAALEEAIEKDDEMAARLTSAENAQSDLKTSIEDGAESSWRPPWLETTMPSAPIRSAISASCGLRMPLMTR